MNSIKKRTIGSRGAELTFSEAFKDDSAVAICVSVERADRRRATSTNVNAIYVVVKPQLCASRRGALYAKHAG